MVCSYSNVIAIKHGINSALIAGYIDFCLTYADEDYLWVRLTQKQLTAIFPFMGRKAVKSAVDRLIKANIIAKKQFGKCNFDHANHYTVTDYGKKIMNGDDNFERKV